MCKNEREAIREEVRQEMKKRLCALTSRYKVVRNNLDPESYFSSGGITVGLHFADDYFEIDTGCLNTSDATALHEAVAQALDSIEQEIVAQLADLGVVV